MKKNVSVSRIRLRAFLLAVLVITVCALTACGNNQKRGDAKAIADPSSPAFYTGAIGGEITISCYDTMTYRSFLEEAARSFEAKYPGTTVRVETFSVMPEIKTSEQGNTSMMLVQSNDSPQDRSDYISKVNTGLMSGSGADIFAMDVLPIPKLADGGQLENLETYMNTDPDFTKTDYRINIIEAGRYHNGLWFLPMDYTFNFYTYDSALIESDAFGTGSAFSAEELFALGAPHFDGSAKLFNTYDFVNNIGNGMAGLLFLENLPSFVDLENKKADFSSGSFASLLESIKKYGELGYIPQGITGLGRQAGAELIGGQAGSQQLDRYYFKSKGNFSLLQQFTRGSGMRILTEGGGAKGIEDDDEIAGIQANADGTVPFDFSQGYGINANSKNKRTAWEFLKYLLSDEMQLSTNLRPQVLPVNNAARRQKAELALSGSFMGRKGAPLDDRQREILQKYGDALEIMSDRIDSYIFQDQIIMDMVSQEEYNFFSGAKTAEDAVRTLQNKTDLYLNE